MTVGLSCLAASLLGSSFDCRFNSSYPRKLILGGAGRKGGSFWLRSVEHASQLREGVKCGMRRRDLSFFLLFKRHVHDRDCVDGFLINIIVLLVLASTPTKLVNDISN
jgi:hypothetical protein